jgi:hypothetical protein
MIKEYDPNIRWSRHTIELTFMQWDYSLTMEVDVTGNCMGASLFSGAIEVAFDELYDSDSEFSTIYLERQSEDEGCIDTLEVTLDSTYELKDICVGIKIVRRVEESRE